MSYTVTGTQKLHHLQTDLEKGRIKLPQFQRDYVWDIEKTAALVDSILRGFPVGDLIYWHTDDRLREVRNLGRLEFPNADKGEKVHYVLDGQQRLTSIISSLLGLTVTRKNGSTIDFSSLLVHLNPVDRESPIVRNDYPEDEAGAYCVPLTQLWKRRGKEYESCPGTLRESRDKLSDRLIICEIPKVTLEDADLSIATDVFSRINTGGLELTVFEIMVARTFDQKKQFDLVEKFGEFSEELKDANYESFSSTDILQLISLMLEDDCKKKTILSLDKQRFIETWPDAVEAVKAAVDYVKTAFRVPVSRLLPYSSLLIPFSLFFHDNDLRPPKKAQAALLEDFFWKAGWSERYSSSSDSKLAQDKRMVKRFLKGKAVRFDWVANMDVDHCRDAPFSASQAFSKTILALLATLHPKKYSNGDLVNLQNDWMRQANSMNFHHVFPRAYLKKDGWEKWEINRVLNISLVDDFLNKRVMRDRAPAEYMDEFKNENTSFDDTMETQLIRVHQHPRNRKKSAAIWSNDYERFINERAEDIVGLLKSRLRKKEGKETVRMAR